MNAQEAEKLFKRTRRKFRRWSAAKCSGYVHGAGDGLTATRSFPTETSYVNDIMREREKPPDYAVGYVYGFVDAYGSDALTKRWYQQVAKALGADLKLEYRWWDD